MEFLRIILNLAHFLLGLRTVLANWLMKLEKPVGYSYRKMMKVHETSLTQFRHDSKSVTKLPLHLGILVQEDDISLTDIANIVVWCMAMGISYISIYDRSGICKRSKDVFHQTLLKQQKSILHKDSCKYLPCLHTGCSNNNRRADTGLCSSKRVDIVLLSMEDGRQNLVQTTKTLCRAAVSHQLRTKDILPSYVDNILQEQHGFPDPDLLLKFGTVESLLGFLPWQIRLTEMISLPTHHHLEYKSFKQTLLAYSDTEKRFGK